MSRRTEHLCDDILDKHALVQLNSIGKDAVVNVLCRKFALSKRHADEKPRIAKIAFERHPLAIHL